MVGQASMTASCCYLGPWCPAGCADEGGAAHCGARGGCRGGVAESAACGGGVRSCGGEVCCGASCGRGCAGLAVVFGLRDSLLRRFAARAGLFAVAGRSPTNTPRTSRAQTNEVPHNTRDRQTGTAQRQQEEDSPESRTAGNGTATKQQQLDRHTRQQRKDDRPAQHTQATCSCALLAMPLLSVPLLGLPLQAAVGLTQAAPCPAPPSGSSCYQLAQDLQDRGNLRKKTSSGPHARAHAPSRSSASRCCPKTATRGKHRGWKAYTAQHLLCATGWLDRTWPRRRPEK
jgi:hypothetical protein